jgi:hypothetical protein
VIVQETVSVQALLYTDVLVIMASMQLIVPRGNVLMIAQEKEFVVKLMEKEFVHVQRDLADWIVPKRLAFKIAIPMENASMVSAIVTEVGKVNYAKRKLASTIVQIEGSA